jgi:MoxR-like ATPase
VVGLGELEQLHKIVRDVFVHDSVREYIVAVVRASRESNELLMGASPRATLQLMRAAQAHAAMDGVDFVRPDDVKAVAASVLSHRVMPKAELRLKGGGAEDVINRILQTIVAPVPTR